MRKSDILQDLDRDQDGRLLLDNLKPGVDYVENEENKGKRDKRWIVFSDKKYLVKEIKEDTFEDYSELLVEQLCLQLGFPCAHYDLAIFNGKPCVITEDFIKSPSEKLISGKTFLLSTANILYENGLYDRKIIGDQKELNNLDMIKKCLEVYLSSDEVEEEMKSFDLLFALNCFCQNGDIHLSNWSVIHDYQADCAYRLAPNYDFGGYFRFNLKKSNLSKYLRNLARQKRTDMITKILDNDIFGIDYNKHNSINYSYDSTDELGITRLEEAYLNDPIRFSEVIQRLFELDPYEAIVNVKKQLGADIPEECMDWFIMVIEANHRRLEEIVNQLYSQKEGENGYGF